MKRALLCVWLSTGCAGIGAQVRTNEEGRIDEEQTVEDVPVVGFEVRVMSVWSAPTIGGELLAVDRAHVWVMTPEGAVAVHRPDLDQVHVTLEGAGPAGVGVWTGLLTGSAASHGFLAIVTGPLLLVAGIVDTAVVGAHHVATFKGQKTTTLWQFARFPQGLPIDLWNCAEHERMAGEGVHTPVKVAETVPWLTRIGEATEGTRAGEAGTGCLEGGVTLHSGPDSNTNGLLDVPAEVQTTRLVCKQREGFPADCPPLEGNLTIHSAGEWAVLVRTGCGAILGDLTLDLAAPEELAPATRLTMVGGTVRVRNTGLTRLELPGLTQAGALDVSRNLALTSLGFPALTAVGDFFVQDNPVLTTLRTPGLTMVKGRLVVGGNAALPQCVVDSIMSHSTAPSSLSTSRNHERCPTAAPDPSP